VPVNVTDFSIDGINCVTFSANVNINYRLTIKVYYHICTLRHIKIEIIPVINGLSTQLACFNFLKYFKLLHSTLSNSYTTGIINNQQFFFIQNKFIYKCDSCAETK
jgi:hypothetical protein